MRRHAYLRNMMNSWKEVTGNEVKFESDLCTSSVTFWMSSNRVGNRADGNVKNDTNDKVVSILRFCKEPKFRKEIFGLLGVTYQFKNFKNYIEPLLKNDYLELTLPDKPTSPKQQYQTTRKGLLFLDAL